MFSERLENLIKSSLQDGMLSEQEKAAIIKRAQAEGEDINEVDIYIQSLQQKRQQELEQQAKQSESEEIIAQKKAKEAKEAAIAENEKERVKLLRICPNCHAQIPATSRVCPECNFVIETDDSQAEIQRLMSEISVASKKLKFSCGRIEEGKEETRVSKSVYEKLSEQGAETEYFEYNKGKEYYKIERFPYFSLMTNLELSFGTHPIVKSFILKEKSSVVLRILKEIEDTDWDWDHQIDYAQDYINLLITQYSDVPGIQQKIDEYQNKINKCKKKKIEEKKKMSIGGFFSTLTKFISIIWTLVCMFGAIWLLYYAYKFLH